MITHADTLRAALAELVAVKTLKDDTEKLHFIGPNGEHGEGWKAIYDAQRAEYIRRQPLAWDAARAALAATEAEAKKWQTSCVTLSALQLHEALEFAAPDFDEDEDQRETEVCIAWAPENTVRNDEGGFEAPGYVVWLEEYPEEGCMPLDGGNPRPYSAVSRDIAKHHASKAATAAVTPEMVNRFLGWRLPDGFRPDCFVSFDAERAKANGSWPIGTNLLDAEQAKTMLQHIVGG